ncbi:ankyrin repeat-containing domain protein [Peziza echinospora]|nr:ankyrin repeat-containing domain protein [Peziza echinospora]
MANIDNIFDTLCYESTVIRKFKFSDISDDSAAEKAEATTATFDHLDPRKSIPVEIEECDPVSEEEEEENLEYDDMLIETTIHTITAPPDPLDPGKTIPVEIEEWETLPKRVAIEDDGRDEEKTDEGIYDPAARTRIVTQRLRTGDPELDIGRKVSVKLPVAALGPPQKERKVALFSREDWYFGHVELNKRLLVVMGLKKHRRYLLEFLGWYENETHFFIAMESLPKSVPDLSKLGWFAQQTEEAKKSISAQILLGLRAIHHGGIVHGDLHPKNIHVMCESPYLIRIGGFGIHEPAIRQRLQHGESLSGHFRGRMFSYLAPEVFNLFCTRAYTGHDRGNIMLPELTPAADIWSVGCLVGFIHNDFRINNDEEFIRAASFGQLLECEYGKPTTRFDKVKMKFINRCLRGMPEDRFQNAEEALEDEWIAGDKLVVEDRAAGGIKRFSRGKFRSVGSNMHSCKDLHCAVRHGNEDALDKVLMRSAPSSAGIDERNLQGRTPLYTAILHHHAHIVRYLIKHGASVNVADPRGYTPLHIAASEGHLEIVQTLVEAGADVNANIPPGNYGRYLPDWVTPYYLAVHHRNSEDVVLYLLPQVNFPIPPDHSPSRVLYHTDIPVVIRSGQEKVALALLERYKFEITPNLIQSFGRMRRANWNLLHYAASALQGNTKIAGALLDLGFDVSAQTDGGETPLSLATYSDNAEMMAFLLDHGAPVTTTYPWWSERKHREPGRPMFLHALQHGCVRATRFLCERGEDINAILRNKDRPFHYEEELDYHFGVFEVAKILVEYGADISEVCDGGYFPEGWFARQKLPKRSKDDLEYEERE